jgi:translocon-associated protein subunit alpha
MFKQLLFLSFVILASLSVVIRSEDDVIIETADDKAPDVEGAGLPLEKTAEEAEAAAATLTVSPDADTTVHFTFPQSPKEIPTNKPVRLLIGFRNKGQSDFVVDYLDASLRYPMDYSYVITNFTAIRYSRLVSAQQEATFDYGFFLHDAFASRPFTLSINLHYHDVTDKLFSSPVFNETILVVEVDEGLDSQTFFLYLIFAAVVVLLGLLGQQYFFAHSKKRSSVKKTVSPTVESGTSKNGEVDYDWLPESTLRSMNKSPKKSPTQSRSPQQSPKAKKRS